MIATLAQTAFDFDNPVARGSNAPALVMALGNGCGTARAQVDITRLADLCLEDSIACLRSRTTTNVRTFARCDLNSKLWCAHNRVVVVLVCTTSRSVHVDHLGTNTNPRPAWSLPPAVAANDSTLF